MKSLKAATPCMCGRGTVSPGFGCCARCQEQLVAVLTEIAGSPDVLSLDAELDVVLAGLARVPQPRVERHAALSEPAQARSASALPSTRLMVDERVYRLRRRLSAAMGALRSAMLAGHLPGARDRLLAHETAELARQLLDFHVDVLVRRPDVVRLLTDLTAATRAIWRAIDRPADHMYAGPCGENGCGGELWGIRSDAKKSPQWATCSKCGAQCDLVSHRKWLIFHSRDELASAEVIAGGSEVLLGFEVRASTIRSWASRGQLIARGGARYRVGDVLDLAIAQHLRAAKRNAKAQ